MKGSGSWTKFSVSENTVYVASQRPKTPWSGGTAPCISFLELSDPWVAGAKTDEEVAGRVSAMINSMHDTFIYDIIDGGPRYGVTSLFDFKMLLQDLRKSGSEPYPVKINCYDCARMVTIFSNLWGCFLGVRIMVGNNGNGFLLNKVIAIGTGYWKIPFKGGFSFHAVAVNITGKTANPRNSDFMVYDACLEYDSRKTPWDNVPDSQRAVFLPVNVPFSMISGFPAVPMTEAPDNFYREHLAANNKYGAAECTMVDYAYDPRLKFSAGEQMTVETRERYRYDKWVSGQSAFYKPDSMIQFEDYVLAESRAYLRIAGSYHNSYVHKDFPQNTIELIVVPCRNQSMAHEVMLQRLSSLSSNDLKLTEPDGVFSEASVLFTSQNDSGTVKMTCIGNLFLSVVTGGQANAEQVCRTLNRYIKTAGG